MSPEHIKDIKMFKQIVQYNVGYLKHNQGQVSRESGLSVPTISTVMKTEFNAESALWLSTIAKIQDYNKRYVETKNYLLSLTAPEVQFRKRDKEAKKIKPAIDPDPVKKKEPKPIVKHKEPKESNYNMDDFVPDIKHEPIMSSELIANIRKSFPNAEIQINIIIKPPQI